MGVSFLGIIVFPLIVFATYRMGRWMLAPLLAASQQTPRPRLQFFTLDIYALMVPIALSGVLFPSAWRQVFLDPKDAMLYQFLLVLWPLGYPLCWFYGIRALSDAGIQKAAPRLVTLLGTIPFAFMSSFIAIVAGIAMLLLLLPPHAHRSSAYLQILGIFFGFAVMAAVITGVFFGIRQLSFWAMHHGTCLPASSAQEAPPLNPTAPEKT